MPDAVVIGAGPNGLVAANMLADAGWDVAVFEAEDTPGGGVRSSELIEPGYVNDLCSAFYPLGVASPVIASLELERHGLEWLVPDVSLAHPASDGTCVAIGSDIDVTRGSLDELTPGDGDAWTALYGRWQELGSHVIAALMHPFPPVRAVLRTMRAAPPADLLDAARLGAVTVARLGEETFEGAGGRRLLAGLALHADLSPQSALGGFFAWLLACLAQDVGFAVPRGGAQQLTTALVSRLEASGGTLTCDAPVGEVVVRGGRAVGVEVHGLGPIEARRAVVADTDALQLYCHLVAADALPDRFLRRLDRFQWDHATFKVDWNLDGPIPWSAPLARRAAAVHVAEDVDELTMAAAHVATRRVPDDLPLVCGQQSPTDPTRQPAGKETAWAYTHLPRTIRSGAGHGPAPLGDDERRRVTERIEARIETLAPGFRSLVRDRHVTTPAGFAGHDRNLSLGALNLGSAQLHQQVIFRPVPGLGRAETPVKGLFLGSASAHPGGGVHGACGANAARAALAHDRLRRATAPARWFTDRVRG